MVKRIKHKFGLSFKDVCRYIPNLTIDNEVVTDNAILHLKIGIQTQQNKAKTLHLFIDTVTQQYCFDSKYSNNQDNCDLLYEIGDTILAKLHCFSGDVEGLVKYVKRNITLLSFNINLKQD